MSGTSKRHLRLATAALLTTLLGVSWVPSLSLASGPSNPEVTDPAGDVNPGAFFMQDLPENAPAFDDQGAYDLRSLYVLVESKDEIRLEFGVVDLPDSWAEPADLSQDVSGPDAPDAPALQDEQPLVSLVAYFRIGEGALTAVYANFHQPLAAPDEAPVGVLDDYYLVRGGQTTALSGTFDAAADTVTVSVPKSAIGNPKAGDVLNGIRGEGRIGNTPLDFAPDAVDVPPGTAVSVETVTVLLKSLLGEAIIVEPQPGTAYTFRGDAPATGDIRLAADAPSKTVKGGEAASYVLHVTNKGGASDTVFLSLSKPNAGFAFRLEKSELLLDAGQSQDVIVTVTTARGAAGASDAVVSSLSRTKDADTFTFKTQIDASSLPTHTKTTTKTGGTTGVDQADPNAQKDAKSSHGKRVPGVESTVLLAVLTAGAVAWRRRY